MLYIKLAMHSVHASSSQLLKSFEVDSSHIYAAVKSSQVECDQVDGGRLGVILASSRVTFLYRSDSQVYSSCDENRRIKEFKLASFFENLRYSWEQQWCGRASDVLCVGCNYDSTSIARRSTPIRLLFAVELPSNRSRSRLEATVRRRSERRIPKRGVVEKKIRSGARNHRHKLNENIGVRENSDWGRTKLLILKCS